MARGRPKVNTPEISRKKDRDRARRWYHNNLSRARANRREEKRRRLYPNPTRPCPKTCEICGNPPTKRALHLDHCHVSGKFRGWLCSACNALLGMAKDDIRNLFRAVTYLVEHG